jgi:hypothetical protein
MHAYKPTLAALCALFLLAAAWAPPARAQPPAPNQPAPPAPPDDPDLPDLPTEVAVPDSREGRHLDWALRVINRTQPPGDLTARFTERFLEIYPPKSIERELTSVRRDAFDDARVFPASLEHAEDSIRAVIVGEGTRRALSLLIVVDPAADKIAGLYLDRANIPGGADADGQAPAWDELDNTGGIRGEAAFGAYEILVVQPPPNAPQPNAPNLTTLRLAPIHEFGDGRRLAIAGAASLLVLAPLADAANAPIPAPPPEPAPAPPPIRWDTPVPFDPARAPLPTSALAPGAPTTVATLAVALLDPRDATAMDHAIALLTRDALERDADVHAEDKILNTPFLYREEVLRVRASIDPEAGPPIHQLAGRFARADANLRRQLLTDEVAFLPWDADLAAAYSRRALAQTPPIPGERFVGHFSTVRDLATAAMRIDQASRAPGADALRAALTAPRPAPLPEAAAPDAADPAAPPAPPANTWRHEATIFAEEPGVIASVSILERADNRRFIIVAIQNHDAAGLDAPRVHDLISRGRGILAAYTRQPRGTPPVNAPAAE